MSEAIVSSVVRTLTDLLKEETKFVAGVDGQVQGITNELKMLQSFLKDADARQSEGEAVRTWVEDAREVAYQAEEVLETYVMEVQSKRRGGILNVLKRFACLLTECILLHKVGKEIQGIKTRISQLTDQLDKYGIRSSIREGESSSSAHELRRQFRRSYSRVVEEDFVGLKGDVKNMVDHLVNEERDKYYQVLSICGMGGLGKTTLAQKIYNHPSVKRHFDMFVWICISQKWETNDILQGMLIKFIPEKRKEIMKWRNEELVRELLQIQQNKRCLVVLDDIWSADAWNCIKPAFPVGKTGSKILLTTRNIDVASQVDPNGFLYQPRILSEDESWELLQKKALRNRESTDPSYVEKMELGSKMVKYCEGLPLAVVVLGGLLATKETLSEWDMVHKNVKSYLNRGKSTEHGGQLEDIFTLSYDDLPYLLKLCFLYLGNFKEDSEIEVERLYQLWIAEGMVPSDDRLEEETMMDVAERYLGELAHRCMVQVQLEEESTIRKFKSCRLHDLMRELCLSKGKEDNFLKVIDYQHGDDDEQVESYASTNSTRRVTIYLGQEDVSQYVSPKKETVRHLRSLLVFISDEYEGRMSRMMKSQFNNFKMLKVLAIEGLVPNTPDMSTIEALGVIIDHWKLPKEIGNLIHLRYLSLRESGFVNFPSSIGNLNNLQTLDLRIVIVFLWNVNVLRKMGRLRHLYLPHFDGIDYTFVVEKVRLDGLSKLEILENFDAAYCVVKDLSKLINLRELTANVKKLEDLRAIMKHVGNITPNRLRNLSLNIECRFCSEDELTLLTQLLGCPVLQKLEIDGLIGKLPEHTNFSSSLTQLSLYGSGLEEDPMATLEKLPNLHRLTLGDAFIGEEIVCSAMGFPQLKELIPHDLNNLQKWRVDKGAMPNLSTLEIHSCEKLQRLPEGLKFVTTLQELVIWNMPDEFKERIRIVDGQEGEDFDRVRHIPSIVC